ncbi:MAG: hypothetical protein ACRDS9_28165 [Pseudonocardiaceae bacterium]
MELLLFGAFVWMVIWGIGWAIDEHKKEKNEKKEQEEQARQAEEKSRLAAARKTQINDPRWVGAELVRLVSVGDAQGIYSLAEKLPGWPVRAALFDAAKQLAVLARGVGMAEPAGVPAAMVEELHTSIEGAKAMLSSVAVKVVSLTKQSGEDWKALPDEARRWLESDMKTLRTIESAAVSLRQSLTVAIAAGEHSSGQRGQQSGHTLHGLADAIRGLSQPTR